MLAAYGDEAGFVEQVVGGVQDQLAVGEFGVGEAVEAQAVGVAGFGVDVGADEVAMNVLSRYGNNSGPRHIEFLKHLLKYCKYSKKIDSCFTHTMDQRTLIL